MIMMIKLVIVMHFPVTMMTRMRYITRCKAETQYHHQSYYQLSGFHFSCFIVIAYTGSKSMPAEISATYRRSQCS